MVKRGRRGKNAVRKHIWVVHLTDLSPVVISAGRTTTTTKAAVASLGYIPPARHAAADATTLTRRGQALGVSPPEYPVFQ
jgi:hypothetical protein